MAPTHLAAGAAAGLAAAHVFHYPPALSMVLGALAGLLPDIDHPYGSIRQRLPGSKLLLFWLGHRGLTHTAAVWLVFSALIGIILPNYAANTIAYGYGSHLLMDMLTVRGVPYFAPFINRNISLLPIRAGGWIENLVIMPGLFMLIAFMLLGGR